MLPLNRLRVAVYTFSALIGAVTDLYGILISFDEKTH